MADVLFVVPVFETVFSRDCNGTILLATILKEKGMDINIYRYYETKATDNFSEFVEDTVKNILARKPKIVSFYCRSDCYLMNIRVAERIKKSNPEIYIVFGGPQADTSAIETIKRIPFVDYCCCGEGETTVFPLFNGLINNNDVSDIPGLTYKNSDGVVISNPRPDMIEDLDTLPFDDYSFTPKEFISCAMKESRSFHLDVGRGCPYNCAYCSTSVFWKRKFRVKSSKRIFQEMIRAEKELGAESFVLDHDLFTANKKKVLEFCRMLKENGFDKSWICSSRADTIDKETIEEMASAGLKRIYIGIETGSSRMQKLTHKNLNLDVAIETIKTLLKNNVGVTASFIYGFPEETEEDVEQTLQVAYRLFEMGVNKIQFHLCTIFPGTEYYDTYKDSLVFSETITDAVGTFGLEENREFIKANKDIFSSYFEYRSELRDRLLGLSKVVKIVFAMYKKLCECDPERFKDMRLIDMFFGFKKSNKVIDETNTDYDYQLNEINLIRNYLSTIYDKEELEVLCGGFEFYHDLRVINKNANDHIEVKFYDIDVADFDKGKFLSEIKRTPVMVCIKKVDDKISYIVNPAMNI